MIYMKKIIYVLTILVVLILNTNCASMKYNKKHREEMETKRIQDEADRKAAEFNAKIEAEIKLQNMINAMEVGTSDVDFVKAWGEPTSVTALKNKKNKALYYDDYDVAYVFYFQNNKLIFHEKDLQRTQYLQTQIKLAELERQIRLNKAQADYDNAMNNLGNILNTANSFQMQNQLKQIQYNQLNQQQQPQPRIQGIPTR